MLALHSSKKKRMHANVNYFLYALHSLLSKTKKNVGTFFQTTPVKLNTQPCENSITVDCENLNTLACENAMFNREHAAWKERIERECNAQNKQPLFLLCSSRLCATNEVGSPQRFASPRMLMLPAEAVQTPTSPPAISITSPRGTVSTYHDHFQNLHRDKVKKQRQDRMIARGRLRLNMQKN